MFSPLYFLKTFRYFDKDPVCVSYYYTDTDIQVISSLGRNDILVLLYFCCLIPIETSKQSQLFTHFVKVIYQDFKTHLCFVCLLGLTYLFIYFDNAYLFAYCSSHIRFNVLLFKVPVIHFYVLRVFFQNIFF